MTMGYSYIVNDIERKGEKDALIQEAKNLLEEFNDKTIADITGLDLEEIVKLRAKSKEV